MIRFPDVTWFDENATIEVRDEPEVYPDRGYLVLRSFLIVWTGSTDIHQALEQADELTLYPDTIQIRVGELITIRRREAERMAFDILPERKRS